MRKERKYSVIRLNKRIRYNDKRNLYTLKLKRKHNLWWLLLFLLPLLLLVRCQKDIRVSCNELDSKAPVEDIPVKMEYHAHYLWNKGKLFASDSISVTQKTNANGETVFKDLPCSVYSYIFWVNGQKVGCFGRSFFEVDKK